MSKEAFNYFNEYFNGFDSPNRLDEVIELVQNGIENDSFIFYYQPKVSLASESYGNVNSLEALLRYRTKYEGKEIILPPFESFLDMLKNYGQMEYLGEHLIKKALDDIRFLHDNPYLAEPGVAINLTADQIRSREALKNESFSDFLVKEVDAKKIDRSKLSLELVEDEGISTDDLVLDELTKLDALGFNLMLDDFGTKNNQSQVLTLLAKNDTFNYLFSGFKIDKSDTFTIGTDENKVEKWVNYMTKKRLLGMKLVVEGVESEKHLDFLLKISRKNGRISKSISNLEIALESFDEDRTSEILNFKEYLKKYFCRLINGCNKTLIDELQGFYFSRPVDRYNARDMLKPNFFEDRLKYLNK